MSDKRMPFVSRIFDFALIISAKRAFSKITRAIVATRRNFRIISRVFVSCSRDFQIISKVIVSHQGEPYFLFPPESSNLKSSTSDYLHAAATRARRMPQHFLTLSSRYGIPGEWSALPFRSDAMLRISRRLEYDAARCLSLDNVAAWFALARTWQRDTATPHLVPSLA